MAGWVLETFGKIPQSGDVTETEDFIIAVPEAASLRVNKVRIGIKEQRGGE